MFHTTSVYNSIHTIMQVILCYIISAIPGTCKPLTVCDRLFLSCEIGWLPESHFVQSAFVYKTHCVHTRESALFVIWKQFTVGLPAVAISHCVVYSISPVLFVLLSCFSPVIQSAVPTREQSINNICTQGVLCTYSIHYHTEDKY